MSILQVFSKLEATTGAGKQAVLLNNDSPLLRNILVHALDPFRTYGVRQFHFNPAAGQIVDNESAMWTEVFHVLHQLSTRELSGKAAYAAVESLLFKCGPYADLVSRIILKDLRCGVQATTVNKTFPKLIPTFEVSLAKTLEKHRLKFPVLVETKHDGKRVVAYVRAGEPIRMFSRNGHEVTGYEHIKQQLTWIRDTWNEDFIADGELMFGMFGDRKAKEHEADFIMFDYLPWTDWIAQSSKLSQSQRSEVLSLMFVDHILPSKNIEHLRVSAPEVATSFEYIEFLYKEVVNNGGEGVMVKDPNATYQFKRGFHWMKLKPEESEDLKVIGVFGGEGKYQGMLGGVVVDFKGVKVHVGSGFSDWQRKMYWEQVDANGQFEIVGKTVEVLYTEVTPDGSLRFPRFKCVRDDK